ncbi:acyl-CoA dehydrogenase [Extensimonas sp. H3M7-6]|uniref:acyl-CoA dehydrogenase n=1 Tax=Extensimonas soli TaxID=3031322 RepID=UPI0023DAE289|nr:acyl-CoA dehydrogenase family protein [Extensimonas sp. H3M7-6]MDF1481604.1 acyl-CoA dehydrogenase family protein [Extensimonas sp. H3M7-6]
MIDLNARLDDLDTEDNMLRHAAADYFAQDGNGRGMREWRGKPPGFDKARWREMAAMGWTGLRLPQALGGSDGTLLQATLVLEQAGKALAPEPLIAAAFMPAAALLHGDNPALQAAWLPRLAQGECTLTLAWQESESDQDGSNPTLRAHPSGDIFVLEGCKKYVAAAAAADAFIVSARGPQGDTLLFLVEATAYGLTQRPHALVDGSSWSELEFHGLQVSAQNLVAGPKTAALALQRTLDEARILAAAQMLGVMQRALEITMDYLRTRAQFGRPIGSFQALQHRAADMLIQTELARAVLMQCVQNADVLGSTSADTTLRASAASQAQARCTHAAMHITKEAIQMHGGIGYTDECDIGLYLKKAMVLSSWLGSAHWHRARYGALAPLEADEDKAQSQVIGSGEHAVSIAELRRWIAENFPPEWRYPPSRLSQKTAKPWHEKLYAKGWAAPNWPKEYGGMGLSAYEQVLFQNEFDRHGINLAPNPGLTMLGPLLIQHGTEQQKREHLPKILSGEVRWCQGYSEPQAGSDLADLRTSAVLDGDEFIVNGQKIWTSFAHEADMIFMLVRTDPKAKKQEGISFLLADMRAPGITVKRIRNLGGGEEFCETFFDKVRVPRSNLVGAMNAGWSMAKSLLGSERITIGHPRNARAPLLRLHALAETRQRLQDPVWRARFDALRLDVDDLNALFVRCVDVLRRGKDLGAEVSMLKIWVTETTQRISELLLDTAAEDGVQNASVALAHGGAVHPANVFFVARPATIYAGSNEIQRNILAKAILELPG